MIRCAKCGETKDESEFYAFCSYHCKECRRVRRRARYAPIKEEVRRKRNAIYRDELKRCKTCNKYKPTDEYSHKSDNWDNLNHQCKGCNNRATREKYHSNIEVARDRGRQRHKVHGGKRRARGREWYRKNRERKQAANSAWRRNNPEKSRAIWHRYKARRMNARGDFTDEQWKMVRNYYALNDKCPGCGECEPMTMDHVIPLFRGGPNYISNIQPLCQPCNSSKGYERFTDYRFDGGMFAELVQEAWG